MPEELRTPDEEPKLLAAEHGEFFFVYRDAPKVEIGQVDGAKVALIYDGVQKPGSRWTWKVLERKLT